MSFPLGRPILAMGILSILCAGWLALRQQPARKSLSLWVFDAGQFHQYESLIRSDVEPQLHQSVQLDLVPARAMNMRLPILFMSQDRSRELPDAVEVPIDSIGLYLRPPVKDVGFLPLNDLLAKSGWQEKILASRLASATKDGVIFGIPHDVHPVALAFREDLFGEAGVPLIDDRGRSTVPTWPEFQQKCLQFQTYWRAHGQPTRHAIELPRNNSGALSIVLAQRHIDLVGSDNAIHLSDASVRQTLIFYTNMVAGAWRISDESAPDTALEFKDFSDGNLCAILMPDWKVKAFREHAPALAEKMRLIPLPKFDSTDAPTASYGGTLLCIPRGTPHPEQAWKLAKALYFSPAALADRRRLGILPPLPDEWNKPEYHEPDPYFGGQKSLELYASLARQVPPTRTTPVYAMALLTLSFVQSRAVGYVESHGNVGLEAQCQQWLDLAAADLRRRIEHATFEN